MGATFLSSSLQEFVAPILTVWCNGKVVSIIIWWSQILITEIISLKNRIKAACMNPSPNPLAGLLVMGTLILRFSRGPINDGGLQFLHLLFVSYINIGYYIYINERCLILRCERFFFPLLIH